MNLRRQEATEVPVAVDVTATLVEGHGSNSSKVSTEDPTSSRTSVAMLSSLNSEESPKSSKITIMVGSLSYPVMARGPPCLNKVIPKK